MAEPANGTTEVRLVSAVLTVVMSDGSERRIELGEGSTWMNVLFQREQDGGVEPHWLTGLPTVQSLPGEVFTAAVRAAYPVGHDAVRLIETPAPAGTARRESETVQ